MILESDADWKAAVERKIQRLEASIGKVAGHLTLDLTEDESERGDGEPPQSRVPESDHVSSRAQLEKHSPHDFEIVMDPDSGPAAIPGSIVFPVPMASAEQSLADQDTISRGITTIEKAQAYLYLYQNRSVSDRSHSQVDQFC
nr:hypothetical protein CFP56_41406 [Quercus suber]